MRSADRRADQPRRLGVAREQHAVASDHQDAVARAVGLALGVTLNLGEIDGGDDGALRRAGQPPPGESERAPGAVELELADRETVAGENLVDKRQRRDMPPLFRLAGAHHDAVAVDDIDLRRPMHARRQKLQRLGAAFRRRLGQRRLAPRGFEQEPRLVHQRVVIARPGAREPQHARLRLGDELIALPMDIVDEEDKRRQQRQQHQQDEPRAQADARAYVALPG